MSEATSGKWSEVKWSEEKWNEVNDVVFPMIVAVRDAVGPITIWNPRHRYVSKAVNLDSATPYRKECETVCLEAI
jgi:hypothetical protein